MKNKNMSKYDVLVTGRACVDVICVLESYPAENTKLPFDFSLTEAGGQGSTAAACIARLGGNPLYFGKVGNDQHGKFCLSRLSENNMDVSSVEIVDNYRTPIAYIFITRPSGKRTIIYEPSELPKLVLNDETKNIVEDMPVILIDPETSYLAKEICALPRKGKIIYDCEFYSEDAAIFMKYADFFIPTFDFIDEWKPDLQDIDFKEKILTLNSFVTGQLIVTSGKNGAYYMDGNALINVLPPDVKVVDTTGAGDNFHAAFSLAVSWEYSLIDAVKFAVVVAAFSTQEYGTRKGVPDFKTASAISKNLEIRKL